MTTFLHVASIWDIVQGCSHAESAHGANSLWHGMRSKSLWKTQYGFVCTGAWRSSWTNARTSRFLVVGAALLCAGSFWHVAAGEGGVELRACCCAADLRVGESDIGYWLQSWVLGLLNVQSLESLREASTAQELSACSLPRLVYAYGDCDGNLRRLNILWPQCCFNRVCVQQPADFAQCFCLC